MSEENNENIDNEDVRIFQRFIPFSQILIIVLKLILI